MHIPGAPLLAVTVAIWLITISCCPEPAYAQRRDIPGGTRLAFVRGDTIYIAEQGKPERMVSTLEKAAVASALDGVELSPDGRSILYIRAEGYEQQIAILDVITGGVRKLTSVPSDNVQDARWSPDGKWIAFGMMTMKEPPKTNKELEPAHEDLDLVISGSRALIGIVGVDDKGFRLLVNPDPKRPRFDVSYPVWKSNGQSIVFTAEHRWSEYDLEGKHRSDLSPGMFYPGRRSSIHINNTRGFRYSPDDRFLLFTARHRNMKTGALADETSLFLCDLTERTTLQLTPESMMVGYGAWLPDGSGIVFSGYERTEENLRIISESSPGSSTYRKGAPELVWDLYMVDVNGGKLGVVVPQGGRVVSASKW